ncbi:MAG TPA: HAD-IA family hydrolase [Bacilli bacterium]|nr:HAD-IA family hydrolase [Bacilli bacterium]
MRKYNYLIFDLDGTLLDTVPELRNNLNLAFRDVNLKADFTDDEVMSFLGSGKAVQIKRALKARNYDEKTHFAAVDAALTKYYAENIVALTKPFPGVEKTLEMLANAGYTLFIATNKPHDIALRVVDHFFGDTFTFIKGDAGDGITKPRKEFLEVFVKKYGVKPSEALYIGDSEIDYLTAKNAGISCVLLNYGYDKPFLARKEFTAKLIDEFKEILNLL